MNKQDERQDWTKEEIYLHFMIEAPKKDFDISNHLYRIKASYDKEKNTYYILPLTNPRN